MRHNSYVPSRWFRSECRQPGNQPSSQVWRVTLHNIWYTQKPGISRTSITNQTLQTVSRALSSQILLSINIIDQSSSQFIVKGIVTIKQHNIYIYIHNLQSRLRHSLSTFVMKYNLKLPLLLTQNQSMVWYKTHET